MGRIHLTGNTFDSARQIARRLYAYSTVLLKLFIDHRGSKRVQHIGSGTYAKAGQTHGILTAHHCAACLSGEYVLGLTAAGEASEHNFIVERKHLNIIPVAVPVSEEFGPDLAFIVIADWGKVAQIKASKAFMDLLGDRERMLSSPPERTRAIWYVSGVLGETVKEATPGPGFTEALEFTDYCYAGGANRVFQRDGFDYVEMEIEPGMDHQLPHSFGGMSGGGLWQVPVVRDAEGNLSAVNHFLAGVLFYQGRAENGLRFLRCHGPQSVYKRVVDALV
jgi:hypothetical protein